MTVDIDNLERVPADAIYAGSLRAIGITLDKEIPDCAWVERSAMKMDTKVRVEGDALHMDITMTFDKPFRWVEVPVEVKAI